MSNKTSDKNDAIIEDDVKTLKYIKNDFDWDLQHPNSRTKEELQEAKKYSSAIEHILAEREQKDKRIQELKDRVKMLDEAYTGVIKESKKWFDIAHNSIPKQAVIEAINTHKFAYEELNKKYDNTYYEDDEIRARDFYMIVTEDRIVQVLKKLLEK